VVITVVNSIGFTLLIIDVKMNLIIVGCLQNHLLIEEIGCSDLVVVIFIDQSGS
jgi:hypothetical protein